MTEPDYDALPVGEADRLLRDKIAYHREKMQELGLRRGQRLQRELDAKSTPAEIAVAIGTSAQVVYDLTRKYRKSLDGTAEGSAE
jgi:hypothetical protein